MNRLMWMLLILALAPACTPGSSPTADTAAATTADASVATDASSTNAADPATPSPTPEAVVVEFGTRMKLVSTTASADIAGAAMRKAYAGLVDPELLARWVQNPAAAPGRAVSSPWPERIEIESSSETGSEATVEGTVVEMTSAGVAGKVPIRVNLQRKDDTWVITMVSLTSPSDQTKEGGEGAVALVREYYRLLDEREFRKAYAMWGEAGPPGQTLETFESGYANTDSVRVETGTPSRVEAAAGSRFVDVPVTIVATKRNGATERFEGTYTLRRSVVEGGSPEWRLYRGDIKAR